jgi:hypothetical protein
MAGKPRQIRFFEVWRGNSWTAWEGSLADTLSASTISPDSDLRGLTPRDLQAIFGSRQRVHEVLRRTRRISMEQARALHEELAIPADVPIQAY